MAYRRPAIEVIQDFQAAAAALALPTLPAVVVGPAFQIVDDVDAGIYSEDDLGISSYTYVGLATGAIVDLTNTPSTDAEASAHKGVGVKLSDAYLVKVAMQITGETTLDDNTFNDPTPNAFAAIDPANDGVNYYLDIISGAGLTLGRRLIVSKTDANNIVVASNFAATVSGVKYRILEFRDEETIPEANFAARGITKTASSVDINPGLQSNDGLDVVEATILLSWRALRVDVSGELNAFTDLDSLEAEFGVGAITPANIGPYAVNLALLNTTTEVNLVGLDGGYYTNEEQAYQDAFEYLESTDMYAIAPTTHLAAVHQQLDAHVEGMSVSTVGRERVGIVNRTLVETEVLIPASGIGTVTTEPTGSPNGTSGTDNKTFTDTDNGSFITDGANVGDVVEIIDYAAVQGVDRSITPNEHDWLSTTGVIQLQNAGFTAADLTRFILFQNLNGVGNDQVYDITTITSTARVAVSPSPALTESFDEPTDTRAYVTDSVRALSPASGDSAVAATKTFDFSTSGETFTSADVGRLIHILNSASNDGVKTIATVPVEGGSTFTVLEAVVDETFAGTETMGVYQKAREVSLDTTSDSVDGPTRTWTIINGAFTADDVGRELDVAGATDAGNNTQHTIATVVNSFTVITDLSTTPVTDTFGGIPEFTPTLTTLDVIALAPSTSQDTYIKGTLHPIQSITSNQVLVLANDPTNGFGGTLTDVEYRILKDLSLTEQAAFLAGYASSFANRRLVHTWPDVLAVSINGIATKVPGYFAGPVISALIAGLPSQAGFTNLTVAGFVGRENSDDKFSDTQLDTIAGGGNFIFTQPVADAALLIRHQLTTDLSTIFFQELSVTKNVDLIAKFFRALYRPFLGIYNITDTLLDLLKTRGEGGIQFLKDQRAARVGAPLRRGALTRIEESTTQPDTVEIDIDITVPLPLNNVKLTLLV